MALMYLNITKPFRQFALPFIIVLLIGYVGTSAAQLSTDDPANATGKAAANLVITDGEGSELQLEVKQMPLAQVLDSIAHKTHVPIHYSILPEGLVTATCVGATLKQVLECLLDGRADLIVRNPHGLAKSDSKGQVAEAWILGSRMDGHQPAAGSCTAAVSGQTTDKGTIKLQQGQEGVEAEAEAGLVRIGELLKMARSKNPADREEAIGGLLAEDTLDSPEVKAVLEKALTDPDENVRAQAISSLAHRDGANAAGAIQVALNDESADVRLMAVDSINDDVALLQQAVNDSDETVRSLATIKLEQLSQENANVN
jgi:HEAT repeats